MNALFEESTARRFCAQWHNFFSADSPACIRLRPIASAKHPLRMEANLRSLTQYARTVLDHELSAVNRLVATVPNEFRFLDLVRSRPEYAAFQIATRLLAQGHNEQWLLRQEPVFSSMFRFKEARSRTDSRLHKCMSEDGFVLDVTDLSKPVPTDFYFCVKAQKSIRAPGRIVFDFPELPVEARAKFSEDTALSKASERRYVKCSLDAIDPHLGAEEAVAHFLNNKKTVLQPRGTNLELLDFHKNVVISQDGRYARFNWLDHRVSFAGLVLDKDKVARHRDRIEHSESFRAIVTTFSKASSFARQNDVTSAFRILIEGMDSLFRPIAVFSEKSYTSRFFVNYGARFMGIGSYHDVFAHCYREYRSLGGTRELNR